MRVPYVSLALVAAALLGALAPEAFQYDREAVADGQAWRLVTGQLVHWTPRMTLFDVGVLAACGVWLERRSPRAFRRVMIGAAVLVALAVQLLARHVDVYRGSSGLATAAFAAVAVAHPRRALGVAALLLLTAKITWEMRAGGMVAAGPLPAGAVVVPVVHAAGAFAGVGSYNPVRVRT